MPAVPLVARDGFQSTLSVRRATCAEIDPEWIIWISIHALRKESDLLPVTV